MAEIHNLVVNQGVDEARRAAATAHERRLIDIAAGILSEESDELGFSYSGFCMTSLPYRRLKEDNAVWERKNGRFSLIVEPGVLPENGKLTHYGVPYGARARLILLYLQTQAVKTDTRIVRLGPSMNQWLERLGMSVGGSSYKAAREQLKRLSACRLTFAWSDDNGSSGFHRENVIASQITFSEPAIGDTRQGSFWEDTAALSDSFFQALKKHPVPIYEPAIRLIQSRPMTMDTYVWLCYRLRAVKKPTLITWPILKEQFGTEYADLRFFRRDFLMALKEATAAYPEANVEVSTGGVILKPSRPAVPEKKVFALGG